VVSWGRRPAPPVTFHGRDDASVANGRAVRYEFRLPPNTQLLRVTLAWNDPPGRNLVNNLNLRVTTLPFVPGGAYVCGEPLAGSPGAVGQSPARQSLARRPAGESHRRGA
jgi:hypothetical protein